MGLRFFFSICIKVEQKISYLVDTCTCRCPLRGYRSYNNSNNLSVITLKPYEHIEIKENPEMLIVHYNYYSFDYCFFSTVKHMFLAFNCQSGNELQLEKNWAIFFSSSNPVPLRVDH